MRWRSALLMPFTGLLASAVLAHAVRAVEVVYVYDSAGRLASFQQGDTVITYSYDPAGNLLTRTVPEPDATSLGLIALAVLGVLRRRRALALAVLVTLPTSASAITVCKPSLGMCDFETIGEALAEPPGQTITVMADVYMESNLTISQGTRLESENVMAPEATIIDATGSDLPVFGNAATGATIAGFTIRGGSNLGAPGGGIRIGGGDVTLQHLIVENNFSFSVGGGIGSNSGGNVTIEDSEIRGNSAGRLGGGVGGITNLVIRDSALEGNFVTGTIATVAGGGVHAGSSSTVSIENTSFQGNFISAGVSNTLGGGLFASQSSVSLSDVTFRGNFVQGASNNRGGGAYLASSGVTVTGGSALGNSAEQGGGVYFSNNVDATFAGTSITANNALVEGGGAYCSSSSDLDDFNGILSGNSPDQSFGCDAPPPSGGSVAEMEQGGTVEDPIHTFRGEFFDTYVDLVRSGPMTLEFTRYYASGLQGAGIAGRFGTNWRHNFEWALSQSSSGISIVNHEGRVIDFTGSPGSWTLDSPLDLPYQLDETGGIFTLLDPRTMKSYVFDATGTLTMVVDGFGNTQSLGYTDGLLTSVTDGFGRMIALTYDGQGRIASVSDGTRTVTYGYTGADLTSSTDALGEITSYAYAPGSLLTGFVRPEGNQPFSQTYDGSGRVDSQTNSEGETVSLAFLGLDTTITGPLGNARIHSHNAMGELTSVTGPGGGTVTMTSDATGRRASATDRLGDTTTNSFDTVSGRLSQVVRADGTVTDFTWASRVVGGITRRDLSQVTHRDGTSESFGVDGSGNLTAHTDPAGEVTTRTHDATGQPLTTTNPEGGVTTIGYNADGTVDTVTDTLGEVTTVKHDGLGRFAGVIHPGGAETTIVYDANDRVTSFTDEKGNTSFLGYDANGNLVSFENGAGETTSFAFDSGDLLTAITQPTGESIVVSYDELGRVGSVQDANGNMDTFGYDVQGRFAFRDDPLGQRVSLVYDAEGVPETLTDPLGFETRFDADTLGRITSRMPPLGGVDLVAYDPMGRVESITDPMGNTRTVTRDARGDTTSASRPGGGSVTAYERDGNRNVTRLTDANGNDWMRGYDPGGRPVSTTDPLGNTRTRAYDERGRVETITFPGGMGSETRTYDDVGNLTSRDFSDGTSLSYAYDAANRLVSAGNVAIGYDANGRINASNGITMEHDPAGRMTRMTLAPGIVVDYAYDSADRLIQVDDWLGGTTTLQYDDAGRRTQMTRPNGVVSSWAYDDDGRVVSIAEVGISAIGIGYDAAGRIETVHKNVPFTGNPATVSGTSTTYDAASRRSGASYDAMGRPLSDGNQTYTWDLASRLVNQNDDGRSIDHVYDDLGMPISRPSSSGTETRDLTRNYGLPGAPVSIDSSAGGVPRYNVHTPDGELLFVVESGLPYWMHFDERGNTSFLTDGGGLVFDAYAFGPFGEPIGQWGTTDNPYGFLGQRGAMEMGGGTISLGAALYYEARRRGLVAPDPFPSISPCEETPYDAGTLTSEPGGLEGCASQVGASESAELPVPGLDASDEAARAALREPARALPPDPEAKRLLADSLARSDEARRRAQERETTDYRTQTCVIDPPPLFDPLTELLEKERKEVERLISNLELLLEGARRLRRAASDVAAPTPLIELIRQRQLRKIDRDIRRLRDQIRLLEEQLDMESLIFELQRIVVLC